MKAIEQYFPVVLFITLHKVVLTFVDKTLKYGLLLFCIISSGTFLWRCLLFFFSISDKRNVGLNKLRVVLVKDGD